MTILELSIIIVILAIIVVSNNKKADAYERLQEVKEKEIKLIITQNNILKDVLKSVMKTEGNNERV